jgi:hypothetical protein
LLLRIDCEEAESWSDQEVVQYWCRHLGDTPFLCFAT